MTSRRAPSRSANPSDLCSSLGAAELRVILSLSTPAKIQDFLDRKVAYNKESTMRSPRRVLRDRVGHCLEGALLAAAALAAQGYPPLLMDLAAVRDDDHVLALYKIDGHWGTIAKSNYSSLRAREPVYRTVRELAMSYFEHYHNLKGEKSLRSYAGPVSLRPFGASWVTAEKDLWNIAEHLVQVPHRPLITAAMELRLNRLDSRLRASEKVGLVGG